MKAMSRKKIIKSLKDFKDVIVKCDLCNDCLPICPTYQKTQDKKLSPVNPILLGSEALKKGFKFQAKHLENLSVCALCDRCRISCPVDISLVDLNLALKKQALSKGLSPPGAYKLLLENIKKRGNIYGILNDLRIDITDETLETDDQSNYLLFLGCMNAFEGNIAKVYVEKIRKSAPEASGLVHAGSTTPEEVLSLYFLLKKAGINIKTLGKKEICCGWPVLASGDEKLFKKTIKKIGKSIKKAQVKKIITTCAMCYYILQNYLPKFYPKLNLKFYHTVHIINELLEANQITLKGNPEITAYHESCYLGRYAKEFNLPRKLIRAIAGANFVELEDEQEKAKCCGGSINFMYPDFALWIGQDLIKEAKEKGIKNIINACPLCEMNLNYSVKVGSEDLNVYGIARYIYENLETE